MVLNENCRDVGVGQSDFDRGKLCMRPLILSEEYTHAGNCLHHERSPLTLQPTGKEKTEGNVVVVEKLMSIVEGCPCQLISRSTKRNGGVVPKERT
jgi:hypothetical protein